MPVNVLLVDDEPLVRAGIKALFDTTDEIRVVGEAGDGTEVVDLAARLRPDVVVMDVNMPKVSGITAARRLQDLSPRPRIMMLTALGDDEKVVAAFRAGADGFALKSARTGELIRSVLAVAEGDPVVPPEIMRLMIRRTVEQDTPEVAAARERVSGLGGRERQVLALLGSGANNARIAEALFMAEGTVKAYVSRVLAELHVENRTQAALLAHQIGLTPKDGADAAGAEPRPTV
ncbi:response regulator transcription factor [Streptomyces sp. NBC_01304]|uniref:response regulator transcription factor n=1 Tax=Streptomyces sp. NBC_01304 TaxID=2903818 RepID=UPI002E10A0DF|nr:response regulator transcription factor [Streptomyces sp. NBC_01304]